MKWFNSRALFNVGQDLMARCLTEHDIFSQIECFNVDINDFQGYSTTGNTIFPPLGHPFNISASGLQAYPDFGTFRILQSALSYAFPDFDFSYLTPYCFKVIDSPEDVKSRLSWNFSSCLPGSDDLFQEVWSAIESEIQPATCDIFTYESPCSDAFSAMGALWNVSYFFFNVKQKKILHFHMREGASDFDPMLGDDAGIGDFEEQYAFSVF